MKDQPILMWAVAHWDQGIYCETVRRTRKEAIAAFVSRYVPRGRTWRTESQYRVHRTVRVTVQLWTGH